MCMNMCIIMCMNMCMYMVAIKRSELAPDFDVVGIEIQMLDKDCVDVAADGGVTVAEDAGNAFELRPHVVLDVHRVTLHQLCRREIGSLKIGIIRFALLLAHALLLR